MATFKRGLDAEDRVRTKLESYGCKIQASEKLDHKQKLDFVVMQFPDNPTFYACGVHAYYRDGGHGFISGQDGKTYFFHITNVIDDSLRDLINSLPFTDRAASVDATVGFTNGGFTKAGAKYEQAANVRLHRAA